MWFFPWEYAPAASSSVARHDIGIETLLGSGEKGPAFESEGSQAIRRTGTGLLSDRKVRCSCFALAWVTGIPARHQSLSGSGPERNGKTSCIRECTRYWNFLGNCSRHPSNRTDLAKDPSFGTGTRGMAFLSFRETWNTGWGGCDKKLLLLALEEADPFAVAGCRVVKKHSKMDLLLMLLLLLSREGWPAGNSIEVSEVCPHRIW